jgi:hypothetical protein
MSAVLRPAHRVQYFVESPLIWRLFIAATFESQAHNPFVLKRLSAFLASVVTAVRFLLKTATKARVSQRNIVGNTRTRGVSCGA